MQIAIIAGSQRKPSESTKIAKFVSNILQENHHIQSPVLDLSELHLPLWNEGVWNGDEMWGQIWEPIAQTLNQSDAIIAISPEWNGMASPAIKNFFLLCEADEIAHKPGLIISVSSGAGGAYPVAELRMSSYKNTRICWIPEHLILRNIKVNSLDSQESESIRKRMYYAINLLVNYAIALKPLRDNNVVNHEEFSYGM